MINSLEWTEDKELLDSLEFPLKTKDDESYLKELNKKFQSYKQLINLLIEKNSHLNKSIIEEVENSCSTISKCITLYHNGHAGRSYNELENILNDISNDEYLKLLKSNSHLYRMRVSPETIYDSNEIFHIPFNKRHLVESRRYSIAGLPCLYLGSSHFICWYELNKPNFNNLYSSSFKSTEDLVFLDLTRDINYIKKCSQIYDIIHLLKFYPMTLACNFSTKYQNAKFNDEYIIPNLLLQWVLETESINGIKFLSVKYCNNKHRKKLHNYVIPPKIMDNGKYCSHLYTYFKVTKPSSFAVLMYGPNPGDVIAYQSINDIDAESALFSTYWTTIFGRTEKIIKNLPHYSIVNI